MECSSPGGGGGAGLNLCYWPEDLTTGGSTSYGGVLGDWCAEGHGMDPVVMAAGTAVVSAMATSAWQQARDGAVALWHRAHPDGAEQISRDLEVVRAEVLQARRDGDVSTEQALAGAWQAGLQRLIRQDPALSGEVRRLLDEHLLPALSAGEQARVHSIIQIASAADHSTIYQAGRDITGRPSSS